MEASSEDQSQSYDDSSDIQRSVGAHHAKNQHMQISVGDEGGTSQPPMIGQQYVAQTAKAAQRPSFSFADSSVFEASKQEKEKFDRQQMKKELMKSMTAAEAKKQK